MTQAELYKKWCYYLSLEEDFSATSRYIEPSGQENVVSFEFFKILILTCTEIETIFKYICKETCGEEHGDIAKYKEIILGRFPRIVTTEVFIPRWGEKVYPFRGWDTGPLEWWRAYSDVKHSREKNFKSASYRNAIYALAALNILFFYLAKVNNIDISTLESRANDYIWTPYACKRLACRPEREIPDFDA